VKGLKTRMQMDKDLKSFARLIRVYRFLAR